MREAGIEETSRVIRNRDKFYEEIKQDNVIENDGDMVAVTIKYGGQERFLEGIDV